MTCCNWPSPWTWTAKRKKNWISHAFIGHHQLMIESEHCSMQTSTAKCALQKLFAVHCWWKLSFSLFYFSIETKQRCVHTACAPCVQVYCFIQTYATIACFLLTATPNEQQQTENCQKLLTTLLVLHAFVCPNPNSANIICYVNIHIEVWNACNIYIKDCIHVIMLTHVKPSSFAAK